MRPASVPPVSTSLFRPGCSASALPVLGPSPVTTLNTPGGRPASVKMCASRSVVSGVYSDGFTTVVQPEASTGARLLHEDHQRMVERAWSCPTTPMGVRSV